MIDIQQVLDYWDDLVQEKFPIFWNVEIWAHFFYNKTPLSLKTDAVIVQQNAFKNSLHVKQGYIRLATWQIFFTEYRKTTKKRSENKKNKKILKNLKNVWF